jgi:hypothetical protein
MWDPNIVSVMSPIVVVLRHLRPMHNHALLGGILTRDPREREQVFALFAKFSVFYQIEFCRYLTLLDTTSLIGLFRSFL